MAIYPSLAGCWPTSFWLLPMPYSIGKPTKNTKIKIHQPFLRLFSSIPIGKRLYNDGRQREEIHGERCGVKKKGKKYSAQQQQQQRRRIYITTTRSCKKAPGQQRRRRRQRFERESISCWPSLFSLLLCYRRKVSLCFFFFCFFLPSQ